MKVVVLGGGVVGSLVQLRVPNALVLDRRPSTAPTHRLSSGPMYLWQPLAGVTCTPVEIETLVDGEVWEPDRVRRYKAKIGKRGDEKTWVDQFQHLRDGYLPIWSSAPPFRCVYDTHVRFVDRENHTLHTSRGIIPYDILVSTIPLYTLLELINEPVKGESPFHFSPIFMMKFMLPPDAYGASEDKWVLNYLSSLRTPVYRTTDRGKHRYYESLTAPKNYRPVPPLVPGKIYVDAHDAPIFEHLRRALYAKHAIMTFGRYGAWRPDELTHQTDAHIREWAAISGADTESEPISMDPSQPASPAPMPPMPDRVDGPDRLA